MGKTRPPGTTGAVALLWSLVCITVVYLCILEANIIQFQYFVSMPPLLTRRVLINGDSTFSEVTCKYQWYFKVAIFRIAPLQNRGIILEVLKDEYHFFPFQLPRCQLSHHGNMSCLQFFVPYPSVYHCFLFVATKGEAINPAHIVFTQDL